MTCIELPIEVAGITAPWLEQILRPAFPNIVVRDMNVVEVQASTATRVIVAIEHDGAGGLPDRLCVKGGLDCVEYAKRSVTFRREAMAYDDLLTWATIERPECYFTGVDSRNGQGILVLEDLRASGCTLNAALDAPTVAEAAEYLSALARFHASTWNSARLDRLTWLTVTLSEPDVLRHWWDAAELEHYLHADGRARVVDPSLHDPQLLARAFEALAPAGTRGPSCALHGDTHIGNTYRRPDGRVGFLDWQGVTRGPWARDVSYFVASNLTTEDRRAHERDLLGHYLDELRAGGVAPPSADEAWTEYRRWTLLPLLVWIRNSDQSQPRAANLLGAQRCSDAVMDLDVMGLLRTGSP